jgi:anti-anti-sigma regulatory factor
VAYDVLLSPAAVAARVDKHMLKILKQTENAKLTRVNLHGRFTGEHVAEVEKALPEDGGSKVTLDLSNVTFVDRQAMEFLRCAKLKRVTIENIPSYVMRWIEQEGHSTFLSTDYTDGFS